jgi:ferritin-like metal-binding protein YciE
MATKLNSLNDLLIHELQDIYDAEHQVVKALPKLAQAASTPQLRQAFELHLRQTEGHIQRLDQVFQILGVPAKGRKCEGMAGLIAEGQKTIAEKPAPEVLDAALIAAAQKVEHYEIAAYGCLATYAEMLGQGQAHDLLGQNLAEEEETDQKLTQLAEQIINPRAQTAPGGRAR